MDNFKEISKSKIISRLIIRDADTRKIILDKMIKNVLPKKKGEINE